MSHSTIFLCFPFYFLYASLFPFLSVNKLLLTSTIAKLIHFPSFLYIVTSYSDVLAYTEFPFPWQWTNLTSNLTLKTVSFQSFHLFLSIFHKFFTHTKVFLFPCRRAKSTSSFVQHPPLSPFIFLLLHLSIFTILIWHLSTHHWSIFTYTISVLPYSLGWWIRSTPNLSKQNLFPSFNLLSNVFLALVYQLHGNATHIM